MALREQIERQGRFLFRWRSYIPLLALPLFIVALKQSECLERILGESTQSVWEIFCLSISLFGLLIRCLVAGCVPRGTSGRKTSEQRAETLNTTGMYSIVRNPLYLGNFIIVVGILLFIQVWWLVLMGIFCFLLYYERIIFTEEEFLREKFDGLFLEWSDRTPLWIPKFRNWQKPNLPFSWKTALRKEYSSFFAIAASYTLLDIFADLLSERKLEIKFGWMVFFVVSLIIYVALMLLKKKTKILSVEGR
jgi:protein-S-isoprenylcysteine O-methyltransferase Ste14